MLLITELNEDIQTLEESLESGEKTHYIKGTFLESMIVNRNGRKYPEHIMDKEVSRYVKEMVEKSRAFGELSHPTGPQINLDRVSHIITELKKDGYNYIGKAKIVDTPMGNTVKGILKAGGKLGVSSRGLGSLKKTNEGVMEVQDDYRIATAADIVADPSAPNAFVEGIMEGVEWFYNPEKNIWMQENLDNYRKSIKKLSSKQLEENKLAIFENYITSLLQKQQ